MCRRIALAGLCVLGLVLAAVVYLVVNITSAGPAVNTAGGSGGSTPPPPPTAAEVQSAKRTVARLESQIAPRRTYDSAPALRRSNCE